jgi:hypothetical protein
VATQLLNLGNRVKSIEVLDIRWSASVLV